MDHIGEIAVNNNLHIIEDAAHAFGSLYKDIKVGSIPGSITCFSFDAIKNITCGEGGAVVFSDDSLLEKVQQKRMVGIDKDTWHRYRNERSWFFDVVTNGYRYHMSNINAAIGLAQLPKFDKMNKRKIEIAEMYDEAFCSLYDITLLNHDYTDIGLFMYVMRVNTRRNEMMDYLKDKGIGSGIHYIPIYKYSYFMDRLNKFPVSDMLYDEIITLPLFPDMTDEQVSYVIKAVEYFYE
jgi:perosamine synthetase